VTFGAGVVDETRAEWWYSGTGAWDTAFQSAIDALAGNPGIIRAPNKAFILTTGITISNHRQNLLGGGPQVSIFTYQPTGTGTCVKFYQVGSPLVQCSMKGFGFASPVAYNFTKVAIETRNVEGLTLEDIAVYPWNGNSASIGFKSGGKHTVTTNNCSIRADIPISIVDNPDSIIDIDHYNFHNLYLIADVGSCVQVATGVNLSNVSFDGYQAWVPKTHGFYWKDTTGVGAGANLSFKNIRQEQETVATDFIIYIEHKTGFYGVVIENVYGGLTSKGFGFKNVIGVTLKNTHYENISNNVGIQVDGTVDRLNFDNCFWQTGTTDLDPTGAIHTLGYLKLKEGWGKKNTLLFSDAKYTNDTEFQYSKRATEVPITDNTPLSVATDGVALFCPETFVGVAIISLGAGQSAIFSIGGLTHVATEMSDPGNVFSHTKATIVSVNIYWDAGASRYEVENKTAVNPLLISRVFLGYQP